MLQFPESLRTSRCRLAPAVFKFVMFFCTFPPCFRRVFGVFRPFEATLSTANTDLMAYSRNTERMSSDRLRVLFFLVLVCACTRLFDFVYLGARVSVYLWLIPLTIYLSINLSIYLSTCLYV